MIANMRYRVAAIGVYFAASLAFIYGVMAPNTAGSYWWLLPTISLQLGFGAVIGEWWALPLPLLLIPLSMPAGQGSNTDSGALVWTAVVGLAVLTIPLVAIGVAARRVVLPHRRSLR
jgi:hypothetical protein